MLLTICLLIGAPVAVTSSAYAFLVQKPRVCDKTDLLQTNKIICLIIIRYMTNWDVLGANDFTCRCFWGLKNIKCLILHVQLSQISKANKIKVSVWHHSHVLSENKWIIKVKGKFPMWYITLLRWIKNWLLIVY